MLNQREIIREVVLKMKLEDKFLEIYSYLVEDSNLPATKKLDNILSIIIKSNYPLYISYNSDYSGLTVNSSDNRSAADTLCNLISDWFRYFDSDQIVFAARGITSIALERTLTEAENNTINDAYLIWEFFDNYSIHKEISDIYIKFRNTYCADNAFQSEVMEIVMMALYFISGHTLAFYSDFLKLESLASDYYFTDADKVNFKKVKNIIKRNATVS